MSSYGARQVPQNILNVEFKLFDMLTVRQFLIGFVLLVVAGLFFFLGGGLFFKIIVPFCIIFGGAIVLFVPFNGEPFSTFLSSYMEAMISSQRMVWNKKGIVVKSAFQAMDDFRYGNDPDEDNNRFKFTNKEKILPKRETELDEKEEQFLERDIPNSNSNLEIRNMQKGNRNINDDTASHSTTISNSNIQRQVDLQNFPEDEQDNHEQIPQEQDTEEQNVDINMSVQQTQNTQQEQNQNTQQQQPRFLSKEAQTQAQPQINVNPQQTTGNTYSLKDIAQAPSPKQSEQRNQENDIDLNIHPSQTNQQEFTPPNNQDTIEHSQQREEQLYNDNDQYTTYNQQEAPQAQNQNDSNVEQALQELSEITPPLRDNTSPEKANESSKEFIFGKVENFDETPIPGAAVILKQSDQNQEIVYTNANGDFKTNFEYPEGNYEIYVNHDANEVNSISFYFNPNDNIPLDIKPMQEEEAPNPEQTHQVLENYQETQEPLPQPNYEQDYSYQENDYNTPQAEEPQQHVQQTPYPPEDQESDVFTGDYDNDLFNVNDYNSTDDYQEPIPQYSNSTTQNNQPQQQQTLPNTPTNQNSNVLDFNSLPICGEELDTQFTSIPNTANGIIIDLSNNRIQGALINVYNNSHRIVRTLASGPEGKFYTYSPIENGQYNLEVTYKGEVINNYTVNFNGSTVHPRVIVINI